MRRAEDKLQKAIVDYLRVILPPKHIVFAVPNGSYRTPAEAGILRATGTVAGIPDLCILAPGGIARFIEVKADGGTLNKNQRAINEQLLAMGVDYCVVRSLSDVRVALDHWKIQHREVNS